MLPLRLPHRSFLFGAKSFLNKIYCCSFKPAICYKILTLNEYKVVLNEAENMCVCV